VRALPAKAAACGAVLFLAACQSIPKTETSPVVFSPDANGRIEFLSEHDRPVHVGDKLGVLKSVPSSWLSSNPPIAYTWRFNVSAVPDHALFYIDVEHLSQPAANCYMAVKLNGLEAARLFENTDEFDIEHRHVTRSLLIDHSFFLPGANTLTIAETECIGGHRNRVRNDSLLRVVRLELRYLAPPKPEGQSGTGG
jgi:hypothetical protein